MARETSSIPLLQTLDPASPHEFVVPVKKINDGDDVSFWLASKAYTDIMTFLLQLNASMFPRRASNSGQEKEWSLHDPEVQVSPVAQNLAALLASLNSIIDEAPPDPGPRRFGNVSFRKWHEIADRKIPELMDRYVPAEVLVFGGSSNVPAKAELQAYLLGSFGSAQRLDYGTGHELSFLAFLGCLWKLGAFPESIDGNQERAIVLGVIEPYLELVRRLILTYTLEPAGSHGVWGLDDHSFLPYIFGSAQFSPAISSPSDIATEGSLPDAPNPGDVAKSNVVQRERKRNMYFSAIGFIYDVKKGPFWEHSPILFDISGVKAGWAKINKGMLKMYNAEVLSKFPVVQHFPMGSLFRWEKDPAAAEVAKSVHTSNQPSKAPGITARPQPGLRDPMAEAGPMGAQRVGRAMPPTVGTAAPWASSRGIAQAAPVPSGPNQPTRAPWAARGGAAVGPNAAPTTRAPWAERKP